MTTHSWNDPDEPTAVYDSSRSIPPSEERWFISRGNGTKEQLSASQIIDLCQDGTLSESTPVWRDGLSGWTRLGEVPELAQALRAFSKLPLAPATGVSVAGSSVAGGSVAGGSVAGGSVSNSVSAPASRASLPSLPPPPSLSPPHAFQQLPSLPHTATTTPPQRTTRSPSVIINEQGGVEGSAPLLSLLTIREPYSLQIAGVRRVGVWTLTATVVSLLVGTTLGAILFRGDVIRAAEPVVNLDQQTATVDLNTTAQDPAGQAAANALDAPRAAAEPRAAEPATLPADQPQAARPGVADRGPVAAAPTPVVVKSEPERTRSSAPAKAKAESGAQSGSSFDKNAAGQALSAAAARAARCKPSGGPTGSGQVRITYGSSGQVKSVSVLTPRFQGTSTASCVQMVFRGAKIPAFSGPDATLTRGFTIQ
jgi:hypothetical protein